ncbi:MAG: CPBP family intramembrane metalloprotease [Chitinophagaceae bacterium]|nr:CPBP family intramembrane metalloprotease [Chitinophagaceae bacterium]
MELTSPKPPLLQPSWLRVIIFVLVYLGINLLAYRLLGSGLAITDAICDYLAKVSGNSNRDFNFILLTLFVSFFLSVALVVVFRKWIDRQTVSSLGFAYRTHIPDAIIGFLLPVIILGIVSLILYFNKNLGWADISFSSGDFLNGLLLMIIIAVGEEMVFRGYILNNLIQSLNKWLALAISAALFALMHSNNPSVDIVAMMNLFVGGLLLGINYVFTKNLWFSILLHTAWNFLQGPILGFPVSGVNLQSILHPELKGNVLLTGGGFGLEASLLTGMMLLITVLILYLIYQSRAEEGVHPSV